MKQSVVRARIDNDLKASLCGIGIVRGRLSDAVRIFLGQSLSKEVCRFRFVQGT
jgi:antitoxin component of RelBE/YafQ-DinJ toxin-antitoxin module